MAVMIGVDPHKASHTAVAIGGGEEQLAHKKVRSGGTQAEQLMAWAEPFEARTWAVESAGGLGYLLAQQLVAAGETVLDVPATLASRVRVLSTGRSNKNDPNDALSVAIAALRSPGLRRVEAVGPQRGAATPGQAEHRHRQPPHPTRLSHARTARRARRGRDRQGNQRF